MSHTNQHEQQESLRSGMVHFILSHSYIIFLGSVIAGLILDVFYPIPMFSGYLYQYAGFAMIFLGSVLIYWAQRTSSALPKEVMPKTEERDFAHGPYKYSRNPTHIGLTIMTLGLALTLNSFWSVIFLIVASLLTKFIFLRKEEALLEKRYGRVYADYKKKVSTWV